MSDCSEKFFGGILGHQGWARGNFATLGYTWDIGIGFHFDCDQIDPGLAARFIFKDLTNPGLTGKFIYIDLTNPGLTWENFKDRQD